MWVGSYADFKRLLRLMEKQYESLLADHKVSATKHRRKMLQMSEDEKKRLSASATPRAERLAEIESDIADEKQKLEDAEAEAEGAGRIELTLTGKDNERRSVTGTASELVEYLDGRYIHELELSAPSGNIRNHSMSLRVDRREGLYLGISSTDSQWCIAGFAELSDEIKKQVPKWRFLRTLPFLWAFWVIVSTVGLWFIGDTIAIWTTETGKFSGTTKELVDVVYPWLAVFVTILGIFWSRRTLPAFEIVPAGKRSRGNALFIGVGSPLLGLVIGVLGNALSKAILEG